ncbi:hypothetical protein ACJIZ3_013387 [Penstemon smallii]|uniref:Uncharacterized protein n=1 Tax=Penstemon smallii TaxID=265156 RepID=A0ABD3UQZ4_9LAMI
MANGRIARFITEVAPAQYISVMRNRTSKMLDTIHEEEKESAAAAAGTITNTSYTSTNDSLSQLPYTILPSSSSQSVSASSSLNATKARQGFRGHFPSFISRTVPEQSSSSPLLINFPI